MCTSSCIPFVAENEYWTDEAIFMSLRDFKRGKPLPLNVTSDVNPYQYKPSILPADLWYLCSGVKKDAECGLWVQIGDACEMYSNSSILGSRTTLQFYEGRASHGRKTDWVMQEYRITERCDNGTKDHRALCRVFLAGDYKPPSTHCIADIGVNISDNSDPNTVINVNSRRHENTSDMDCILCGDYIELNDLIDPGSRSSSSANSSCLTVTSDEYFDSMALLQELDKDILDQKICVKYNLSTPAKSKEVVIRPVTSVSLT
ncbi:putative transcription factor NAM family [Helianthus annuus]|uniref:NAC domain-containing protein 26 isoform X2 n=1 Tax=Helianthus annuus TaxID=4232 RepID=UPI000B90A17C|nr:NAC domain-containing protein 26 isoform X2 [Helianthus annuus]KAJ0604285.1 putative transcription factor NAM family [Helianthus annuus]KAJ0618293.1 putative transcription factor NAM family [Helianthus annuus]KAJ0776755.1 putative transcription factor NAM family [Helianthus annuus]KAJ0939329.1 putative transcription factor NAM family [Helianthus annuus]